MSTLESSREDNKVYHMKRPHRHRALLMVRKVGGWGYWQFASTDIFSISFWQVDSFSSREMGQIVVLKYTQCFCLLQCILWISISVHLQRVTERTKCHCGAGRWQQTHFRFYVVAPALFIRGCVGAHASAPLSMPVHVHVLLPCVSLLYCTCKCCHHLLSSLLQSTCVPACLGKMRACAFLQDNYCIYAPAGLLVSGVQDNLLWLITNLERLKIDRWL